MTSVSLSPRVPHPWRAAGAGVSAVLVAVLGACSPAADQAPTEIVLAVTASSTQPQPTLGGAAGEGLRAAVATDRGHLDVLRGTDGGAVNVLDEDVVLRRGAEVEHDAARRERLTGELTAHVDGTLRTLTSDSARLDLLGLLTQVGRLPGPATVVVESSGLQTAAPLDLSTIGWESDPASVADDLGRRGFLPNLAGKRVTFQGLAQVTGAQVPPPTPLRTRVESLWLTLCQRAAAVSCRVDTRPLTEAAPATTVPAVVVPVPAVTSTIGPGATSLPTALLFEPDTARLLPGADPQLAPVAAALADPSRRVSLVGHTASVGPADGAHTLSLARARAIADALVRLGVRPLQITGVDGVGFDQPLAPDRDPAGALDPEAAAANRTVVATVSGGAP